MTTNEQFDQIMQAARECGQRIANEIHQIAQSFHGAVEVHDDPARPPQPPETAEPDPSDASPTPSRLGAAETRTAEILQVEHLNTQKDTNQ